ncbi:MAG TPA: hypothetical protein VGO92_03430 [Acidimicrobiales bacterium]|nr:hypothetical protein [Acidimicrobiales bacterium]
MPAEMVQEKGNGHLRLVDAGTGAVLHGMMGMLSEVLDGLDRRLDAMEGRLADLNQATAGDREGAAGEARRFASELAESLAARIEASVEATVAAALERAVQGLGQRVEGVSTAMAAAVADVDERVAAAADQMGERLDGLASGMAEQMDGLAERLAAADGRFGELGERLDGVGDRLNGLNDRLGGMASRFDAVHAGLNEMAERVGTVEAAVASRFDAVHAGLDVVAVQVAEQVAAADGRFDAVQTGLDAVAQSVADTVEETAGRVEEVVQSVVGRRMAQVEASLAEGRAEAEAAAGRLSSHFEASLDEDRSALANWVEERLAGVRGEITAHVDALEGRLDERLNGVESSVTERVAGEASSLAERVDRSASSTAEKLDQAGAESRTDIETLTLRMAEVDATLAAVRAEGAALPNEVGQQVGAVVGNALSSWRNRIRKGDGEDVLKKVFDDLAARLDRVEQLVGDGMSRVHEAVNRSQGESLEAAQTTTAEVRRLLDAARADVERSAAQTVDAVLQELRLPDPAMASVAERLAAMHQELERREARLATAIQAAGQAASAEPRIAELGQAVTGELARVREAVTQAAAQAARERAITTESIEKVAGALPGVQEALAGLASSDKDKADSSKAVLDAVTRANQDHHDVLQALHSSLSKRFDARTKALGETLDGLAASLEAARTLGPSLDRVSSRLDSQQPYLDQIRHQLVQLAATVASVPADMERRHAEANASLEKVADALGTLRTHAAALDRAVQATRSSHDGLVAAFTDMRDGQGIVPQRLDQIGAAVQAGRQAMAEVGEIARAVAGAVEQQGAMGSRLAELVTQVRAATRSDIERMESTIHLEVLKQHQQDQARLTQAVAGVSEVVEREAAVIHQRVSALANEVDAIRMDLAATSSSD